MSKLKNLVFFGTESFSVPSLEALIADGWPILAVVTKPDRPAGRGRKMNSPAVKSIAQAHDIKVLQPESVEEINDELDSMAPDLGVLVAYGKIIPAKTIDIFPAGIINVHPSLLPRYRGPSPIEASILSGDKETGVSLMKLVPQMDAGPVYRQIRLPLNGSEDKPSLYAKLATVGAEMLNDSLEAIASETLQAEEQDDSAADYTKLLSKEDGLIDWTKPTDVIERQIRAYQGYPKARAKIFDKYEVNVIKGRIAKSEDDGGLVVKTGDGFFEIQQLLGPSGRMMNGEEFSRGYKN
jgi:methionyl-tRNA formyltransferase